MKKTGRHLLLAACMIAPMFTVGPVMAVGDGGTRSVFSLGAGARGMALGRAFVSLADDASALYWNPADLRNVQSKQLMGTYMPLFGDFSDATYTFLGGVYPTLNAGAFGLAFMRIADSFKGYDSEGMETQDGEYSESQFIIAYAAERRWRYLFGTLASGISFKICNVQVSPYSSTAPGIDMGFRYIPDFAKSVSFGLNFQDLSGAEHKLVESTDKTYRTVMAGLGYTRAFSNGSALRLMLQMDFPKVADREFHAGAEYSFSKYLALRMGMDDKKLTFGLGVAVSSFGLDYATFSRDEAGSSQPVSFSTNYGKTLYEQRRIAADRRAIEERELIRQTFDRRIQSHREQAKEYEVKGDIPQALDEWKIVMEYVPGDSEATRHITRGHQLLVDEQARANRDLEKQAVVNNHFSQGLNFYSENDYPRARDEWQEVLKLIPDHAEALAYMQKTQEKINELIAAHRVKAAQYERERRLTEAIGEWNNIILLAPSDKQAEREISRIRSVIDSQSKDFRIAERKLRVIDLYNRALQEFNRGEYENTITDLRDLIKLDPTHAEAKNLLLKAQRKLTPLSKDEEERIRHLYLKGMEYFSKDQYKEAIIEWEKILKIDPGNESVEKNIQEAKDRLKKLEGSSK